MGKELSKACDVACRASVLDSLNQHPPSEENQASPILQAAELNRAIKMREEEGLSRKATNFQQASDDPCFACRELSITSKFTKRIPPRSHGRTNVSRAESVREVPEPASKCMTQDIKSFSRWGGGLTMVAWYVSLG